MVERTTNNHEEYLTYDDVQIRPLYSNISSRSNCDTTSKLTENIQIDVPVVAAPMDTVCGVDMAVELWKLGGFGFIHRFDTVDDQREKVENVLFDIRRYKDHLIDKRGRGVELNEEEKSAYNRNVEVGAAIGATGDYLERAEELLDAGATVILIDVANGNHAHVRKTLTEVKMKWPDVPFVAGNVATKEGTRNLIEWGASAVRVGVGGGSMCSTRIRSGVGIPQVSAIINAYEAKKELDSNIPIIADGGLRSPGDLAKALAAGADTGMFGSVLSGTKETPGPLRRKGRFPDQRLFKHYEGSASFANKQKRGEDTKNIEGNSKTVEYKGKVKRIVREIKEGLQSSMSYVGVDNISEFKDKSELIRITSSGYREAKPHGLDNV